MTPVVLPHNLASPFFLFLSSWCCPLSIAILCGRKSPMDLKVAPMLKKMVLTYNVAPQSFFLRLTQKPVAKKSLGCLAILCVRNGALSARKIVPHYLADPGILYVKPQFWLCGATVVGAYAVFARLFPPPAFRRVLIKRLQCFGLAALPTTHRLWWWRNNGWMVRQRCQAFRCRPLSRTLFAGLMTPDRVIRPARKVLQRLHMPACTTLQQGHRAPLIQVCDVGAGLCTGISHTDLRAVIGRYPTTAHGTWGALCKQ